MGFGTVAGTRISGLYSAGGADSGPEDREEARKKEVDDLISKYASKKQNKLGGGQGSEWALPSSSSSASLAMPSYTAPQVWNFFLSCLLFLKRVSLEGKLMIPHHGG